ncbi:MAG: hypothetical protein ACREOQ_13175 [Gemmatimonadales bacterium]
MHALRAFAAVVATVALVGATTVMPTGAAAQVSVGQPTSWGVIVGRAEANDMRTRILDWQLLRKARALMQVRDLGELLSVARQAQMMGTVEEHEPGPHGELFQTWNTFYLNNVIGPAARIAANPAASCSESQTALTIFYGVDRQRSLLVPDPDENDHSPAAEEVRQAALEWTASRDAIIYQVKWRCRNEQLDECVATGRYDGVLQWLYSEAHETSIIPATGAEDGNTWASDVLRQCAIYELRFRSIGSMDGGRGSGPQGSLLMHLDRSIGGFFSIKFDENFLTHPAEAGSTAVLGGTADGAGSPRLTVSNCKGTAKVGRHTLGRVAGCTPAAFPGKGASEDSDPFSAFADDAETSDESRAKILELKLKHIRFRYIDHPELPSLDALRAFLDAGYRNSLDSVKVDTVDSDRVRVLYGPGEMQAYLTWTVEHGNGRTFEDSVEVWQDFLRATMRSSSGAELTDTTTRTHPVLFQIDTTVQGGRGTKYTDRMVFELVHRPEPKPFVPPADPRRTPARPGAAAPN